MIKQDYNPKYQILLETKQFYPDQFNCLGSQLIKIVNFLKEILNPHIWCAANVTPLNDFFKKKELNSFNLILIGDDSSIIELASEVEQFLSGLFLAVNCKDADQNMNDVYADTEDEQFRPLGLKGVLIEIRLFDTSFFELYSEDEILINKLAAKFQVDVTSRIIER